MRWSVFWKNAAVLAVVVGLAGCGPKIAGLKVDSSFTAKSLRQGKIAVGGVASALGDLDEGSSITFGNLLRTQIIEKRENLNVTPVGAVANRMGKAEYKNLVDEFGRTGAIGPEGLNRLKDTIQGVRYFVFARIEQDDVIKNRRRETQTDRKGKIISRSMRAEVTRTVSATVAIYDVLSGKTVWSANISANKINQSEFDIATGLMGLVQAVQGKTEDEKFPYPDAPTIHSVLEKVFSGVGENLPN